MGVTFRKLIKECVTQVLKEELEDPMYVEYVSERPGENPFVLNNQKFQYVNAKYPNGKTDIGVYAFAGDIVYSYNTFRTMFNIQEATTPAAYYKKGATGPRKMSDLASECPRCYGRGKSLENPKYKCTSCGGSGKLTPPKFTEAFDPTSVGPNPEAGEGLSTDNPYPAWNNKMSQMEDMDHPIDDKTRLPSPHPTDMTTKTSLPASGEEKYYKQQPGGQMAAVNIGERVDDGFDRFRKEIGEKKVNEFLSKFGLGPDYKPSKPKLHECPQCKKCNARYKEMHADTDMNEMALECPDCGHSSSQ